MIPETNPRLAMSIDLGTSSCKVCVLDMRGRVVAAESSGYPTYSPHSGWAEQNPEDWLEAVSESVKKARIRIEREGIPFEVLSITLTSAAHIAVLLDDSGLPLRRALLWSDQRSRAEADRLRESRGDFIFGCGFNNVSTSWTLPHLVWIRDQDPSNWEKAKRICLSKDFILHRLTGEWKTDPATAVSAMLCDAGAGAWSMELCSLASIESSMLPEIVPADSIGGYVTPAAAERFGLTAGIPVVVGTLDSATETYGAGAAAAGDLVIRIGTAGGIHLVKADPSPDPRLLTYPFPSGGLWYSQAGTNSAGSAISWAVAAAGGGRTSADFDSFSRVAASAPAGCDGLLFHPYLSGERTPYWNPSLRGTFSGVSFRHGREHFARAVLEGVAFSLCDAFQAIAGSLEDKRIVRVVGGGCADGLLMEILSSALGRELLPLRGIDSSYGGALFGLRREGRGSGTPEIPSSGRPIVLPRPDLASAYGEAFSNYKRISSHLSSLYEGRP